MKLAKRIFTIIGVLVVVLLLGVFIFMNTASDYDKKSVLQEIGLEDSGFARDFAKESYLECEVLTARKNLLGDKWVIKGNLYTTNKSMNFTEQKIKFMFSDGNEVFSFYKKINGSQIFKRPFSIRIPDHENANFIGVKVVEVN